jgi:hypothetical protein
MGGFLCMRKRLNFLSMQTAMTDCKQELATCCELFMIVGELTGDGPVQPGSTTHSRFSVFRFFGLRIAEGA